MFYVYAVYNQENNKTYIGQTENLAERLKLHNEKEFRGSYTSRFSGEWQLVYQEELGTRKEALIRERQLKSFRGRESIKRLIVNSPVAQR